MKRIIASFLALALMAATGFAASASKDVMILLDSRDQLSSHAVNFIYQTFMYNGIDYNIKYTFNGKDIKPGEFKAIVVLDSKSGKGLDPALAKFIKDYPDKKELILLSFKSGLDTYTVETIQARAAPAGVDTITSATAWGGRSGGRAASDAPRTSSKGGVTSSTYNSSIEMHTAWVQQLVNLIDRM